MKFELKQHNRNVSDKELLDDLKRVSNELKKEKVTILDYKSKGHFHSDTLIRRFGGWNMALKKVGLKMTHTNKISKEELFENMEEVWIKLGRQPSRDEFIKPLSKYSSQTYEKRFGTWRKSLEAFVEYINSDDDEKKDNQKPEVEETLRANEQAFKHKTKRKPSDRLKVQVLMRDGNKCSLCGITVIGDDIHFDHIKPWTKGGETILENLQVLCAPHNIAKSNLEYPTNENEL